MSGAGKHAMSAPPLAPTRLGVTAVVAALVTVAVMIAAVVVTHSGSGQASAGPAPASASPGAVSPSTGSPSTVSPSTGAARANAAPAVSGPGAAKHSAANHGGAPASAPAPGAAPLVLTAADHRSCPATATACVDLARHITWLQAQGKITFGPVRMEPGRPGGGHETPRGAFQVEWKAGPAYQSNIYHVGMPWATFFAAGGIAFHGGSLTAWSHGCVHLTNADAHYYNEHLPVGARVVVF